MSTTEQKVDLREKNSAESENSQMVLTVNHLKQWVMNQKHIPRITSDKLLYHIAAVTKGNNVTACKKLDSYYTVRNLIPEYFSLRDPCAEEIELSCKCVSLGFLPGCNPDGYRVMIFTLLDFDPAAFDLQSCLRRFYMYMDLYFMKDEFNPGQGIIVLVDARGSGLSHVMKLTPNLLRKAFMCTQDVYPISLKGIIFININDVVRVTVNTLILPMLRTKLRKRLHFFGSNNDKLYNIIPKTMLPVDLGGNAPSYSELSGRAQEELISKRNWFLTEGSDNTDESKRIGKCPITAPGCSIM